MTTDLEKQFFDTFGIEPRYEDACTVEDKYWNNEDLANEYGTFDQYMNCKCGNQENCTTECSCAYQKEIYPQITDRILLELICTLNKFTGYTSLLNDTYEEVKEEILKDVLFAHEQLRLNKSELSKQVRTLFEEG